MKTDILDGKEKGVSFPELLDTSHEICDSYYSNVQSSTSDMGDVCVSSVPSQIVRSEAWMSFTTFFMKWVSHIQCYELSVVRITYHSKAIESPWYEISKLNEIING